MPDLRVVVALGLFVALACTSVAHAQSPSDDAEARARFQSGSLALDAGRAEDALADFERAYALSHRPEMLYNIGVAAQRGRHRQRAVDAYRQYMQDVPQATNRAEVVARISEVEELLRAEHATAPHDGAAAQPPAHAPAPPPAPSGPGIAPWVVLISGGVVAITGAVLLGVALADVSSVENPGPGATWAGTSGAYDAAPILSTIGIVAMGVGAAAIAAGIAWLVLGTHSDARPAVQVGIGPGSLSLSGAF